VDVPIYKELNGRFRPFVKGVKLFTDGSIGSRTAALAIPYKTGRNGVLNYTDDELRSCISETENLQTALSIHAIGDRAISQAIRVLGTYKHARGHIPETRMEHCSLISQTDAHKAKDLGIALCMQPNFSIDSIYYRDRLTKDYTIKNNPFRMLIDQAGFVPGVDLLFGSDGMPHGATGALQAAFFPPFPDLQALTLDEVVAGYCMTDMENGHIEFDVNMENQSVFTQVRF